jgi:hypothetical protein
MSVKSQGLDRVCFQVDAHSFEGMRKILKKRRLWTGSDALFRALRSFAEMGAGKMRARKHCGARTY